MDSYLPGPLGEQPRSVPDRPPPNLPAANGTPPTVVVNYPHGPAPTPPAPPPVPAFLSGVTLRGCLLQAVAAFALVLVLTVAGVCGYAVYRVNQLLESPRSAPVPEPTPAPAPAPSPLPAPNPGPGVLPVPAEPDSGPLPEPNTRPSPPPRPAPAPTPAAEEPAFVKAFRDYRSAQKKTLRALADDVRAGKVTDKTAFLRRLADGAQPFEVALDLVFEQNSDTAGKVTKPAALADLLMKASEVFP